MQVSIVPLSRTKITLPARRERLLTRPRLLDALFGMLEKKVILVSAPAGYGKTSLLIDLAHHTDLTVCWLSLDPSDRDPQRFASYLIASLAESFEGFGAESRETLNHLTSEQGIEHLAVTLSNEAYEHIHEHFVLILDDYHLVEDVPGIQNLVNRFIQLVDENCHLVIASRKIVKLPDLTLLVARQQVDGLDYVDLTFRAEEIQALLMQSYHLNISTEQARELAELTEGWITSLQFAGTNILSDRTRLGRVTRVGAFDYLGQQVLDQQPADLREFLLHSAFLEEFNPLFCQAVLGPLLPEPRDWERLVNTVLERNLFVLPVGEDGRWLRYHHLFRDFLQARLKSESPALARNIQRQLAQVYEGQSEWQKAFTLYRELGDTEALADMIERAGPALLVNAVVTLEGWLDALPPSLIQMRPRLLSLRGSVLSVKGDLRTGLDLLNQAESAFRLGNDREGLSRTLVRRTVVHRYLGDYSSSLQDAEEALRLSENADELQNVCAEALRAIGLTLYRMGETRKAAKSLEHSLVIYTRLNETRNIPILLMETGMAYRAIGEYTAAESSYLKALEIWRKEGNLSWQANLLNNLGVLYHLRGEYEKAVLTYEEGLADAQRSRNTRMEAYLRAGLGDLYTEIDEFEAAEQAYRHAEEIAPETGESFLLNYVALAQANLALLRGENAETRRRLADAEAFIQDLNLRYEWGLRNLILGRLALAEGDAAQATSVLRQSESCFTQGGRELESNWSRIWLAAALLQNGQNAEAAAKLQEALSIRGQAAHSLHVHIRQARERLAGLQRDPKVGRTLRSTLEQARRLDAQLPEIHRKMRLLTRTVEMPSPHITIQALGKAQLLINGMLLHSADWQPQSARLFFYFLSLRTPITKEQAIEALWPELDDPNKLKLRFKNFMYRLRRAIGQEVIIFEDDLYHFNRTLDFDYDVEAFESHLARAHTASSLDEKLAHTQKAVDLVRGPYLEDIDAPWVTAERERLGQAFLAGLVSIAEIYWRTNQLEKALRACQRALDHDPYAEAAHRVAMQIYAARGDRAAIVRQYETCKQALQEDLGLSPSAETEALYRQLIA